MKDFGGSWPTLEPDIQIRYPERRERNREYDRRGELAKHRVSDGDGENSMGFFLLER